MKISIITICFNSGTTIRRTIESVLSQKNIDLEYILVDGASNDNTVEIIKEYADKYSCIHFISEKDNGIYDAMNKGISLATGDIIGILNSDDKYAYNNVLSTVCDILGNKKLDSCYGNILYIKTKNNSVKPYRYWKSGKLRSFQYGWMPPHPAFFVKKEIYNKYGNFRLDFGTAADYELMLRFLEKYNITSVWINKLFVYMEAGGASGANLDAYRKSHKSDKEAWLVNNLEPTKGVAWLKKIRKIPQFVTAKFVKI